MVKKIRKLPLKVIGGIVSVFAVAVLLFFQPWHPKVEQRDVQARAVGILASPSNQFKEVSRPAKIRFPEDWQAHPDFRQEWWYVTANLKDTDGNAYGVQWTLFRFAVALGQAAGWENGQVFMAHVVVTSKERQWSAERFARGGIGQAGVTGLPFSAWLDNWRWDSLKADAFPAILSATDSDFSFKLTMRSTGEPILQGEDGFSRKHHALPVASYYYSVPGVLLSGKLVLDGKPLEVSGQGWVDREWGSESLSRSQAGWDWMSLQLSDGRKLMVSQVRESDAEESYKFGSLTSARGETQILSGNDVEMKPTQLVALQNGRVVPSGWKITLKKENLSLSVSPLNMESWLNFSFPYWEGPVDVEGENIRGSGFLEMTGY